MSPMMLDDEPTTPMPGPTIIGSLAVNLACVMCCSNPRGQAGRPLLTSAQLPLDYWDDGWGGGDELVLVAHVAGVQAATDFSTLAAALTGPLPRIGPLRLAGETDQARTLIRHRVDELRRSARRRRGYVEMLEGVWHTFASDWEGALGRRAQREVDRLTGLLRDGRSWRTLSPNPKREAFLDLVLSEVGHDIPIVLVPSLNIGSFFALDINDALVIGLPLPDTGPDDSTEELARRLKALAHPTRLAMVGELARRPATVGELARTFGIAQPTATTHLRQLREAGIVRESEGSRGFCVDADTARGVTSALGEVAGLTGADRT